MNYSGEMDTECVSLCDAINTIPGLRTTSSCSGHEKKPMHIWLNAKDHYDLFVLSRAIDPRYGNKDWNLSVVLTDREETLICFLLSSNKAGKEAYKEANEIARLIAKTLAHGNAMNFYVESKQAKKAGKWYLD